MSRTWRYILPCYLFVGITTLAGLLIAAVFYRASAWKWHDGALGCVAGRAQDGSTRIWGKPGAQTLGWLVIYASEEEREYIDLRVHEYTHIVQAFACSLLGLALGPLLALAAGVSPWWGLALGGFAGGLGFALLYGLLFLYLYFKLGTGWFDAYYANPFEVHARAAQDAWIDSPATKPWGL